MRKRERQRMAGIHLPIKAGALSVISAFSVAALESDLKQWSQSPVPPRTRLAYETRLGTGPTAHSQKMKLILRLARSRRGEEAETLESRAGIAPASAALQAAA